jgi:glutamate carboxypeptidase
MPTASTRHSAAAISRLLALTVVTSLTAVQPLRSQAAAGRRAPAPSAVDSARLMADVRALSAPEMGGRATGTEGNRAARASIVQRFRGLGLKPVGGAFEHPFSFTRQNTTRAGANVIGLVEGTVERDRYTLVSAHYDHLGTRDGAIFHGADDNASGVAGLLAAAAWFKAHPPGRSLLFVAFDAEENGLQGARQFVAQPPVDLKAIDLVINMDMISRGDANTIYVAGTSHYPQLKARVEAIARGRSIEVAFGHDRKLPGAPPSDDWTMASDHGPFHSAGIPFLYFGVEDHPDYHKPTDTADRIPVAFFVEAVKLVIDTIAAFSDAGAAAVRPAQSGSLSAEESALVAYVDAHNGEALALLERVVNINSGSMNFAGVREVGRVFGQELDGLGFTTRWVDGAAFGRAGHLVADHPGPGPRMLLIGHLDTVFEPDSPFQRFERVDARSARGPGIIDMKGGNVVMLQALKALNAAGALTSMNVTVVMTGDEELTGEPLGAARAALVSAAKGAAFALGFENGPGNPRTAVIARRGTTGWQLRVKARPAHSSQIFREDIGAGAIYEAARILTAFREKLAGEPHLTFNPGLMLGGTAVDYDAPQSRGTASGKENVIAEHAVVAGDLRTLSKEQLEAAKERMEEITAASLPHAQATITFDEGYPPLAPTDGNRALLRLYDQASRDVGAGPVGPVDPDRAGAADVSFVAGEVPRILDGIGLMGSNDHTPQETADLATLPSQTKRAAVLLYRLSRGAAGRTR